LPLHIYSYIFTHLITSMKLLSLLLIGVVSIVLIAIQCNGFVPLTSTVRTKVHYSSTDNNDSLEDNENYNGVAIADVSPEEESPSSYSFEELGLMPSVLTAVRSQNDWIVPTPVQRMVMSNILDRDNNDKTTDDDNDSEPSSYSSPPDAVWVEAPTGSGKTAAFLLPLLQNLLLDSSGGPVRSLILCPTRELAQQISNVVNNLIYNLSTKHDTGGITVSSTRRRKQNGPLLSSMVVYGGIPLQEQIQQLSDIAEGKDRPLDILIASPGRLMDILTHYDDDDGKTKAEEAILERTLLEALENDGVDDYDESNSKTSKKKKKKKTRRSNTDTSLSLEQLERLQLDSITAPTDDDTADSSKTLTYNKKNGRLQLRSLLNSVEYFIVDEADRVMGNAFRDEFDGVLDMVLKSTPSPKMWLFSATFPKSIEPRLDEIFSKANVQSPLRLQVDNESRQQVGGANNDINIDNTGTDEDISASLRKKLERANTISSASRHQQVGDASTIQLRTIRLERRDRTQALKRLLQEYGVGDNNSKSRVLVFVSTRYGTEHVSRKLRRAGIQSKELHGKLDQDARIRRLQELSKGKTEVLLCTDVAARGIDIKDIDLVVNYDLPRSTAEFVHRIGRTGRAGRSGTAISFLTADKETHMDLIESRHFSSVDKIPEREVLAAFEPDEEKWTIEARGSKIGIPGAVHSTKGIAWDRMNGGVKGRRKSKKDKLREQAAAVALKERKG